MKPYILLPSNTTPETSVLDKNSETHGNGK